MRKLLIPVLFLWTLIGHAYVSPQQTAQIYQRIVKANGWTFYPGLRYARTNLVNARSGLFYITINEGMLYFCKNQDEMAAVLGHEFAHWKLGHMRSSWNNEYAADAKGVDYMRKAGYNSCRGVKLLARFGNKPSSDHPPGTDRYNRVRCR